MASALLFIIFCATSSVLAFAKHPIWGMYFYMATIFVHPPSRWWGPMLPDLRWALLSAFVTAVAIAAHRGRLAQKPLWLSNGPAVILTLYAIWMWIQTPWALDLDEHLRGSVQFTKYLVAFWFVYRLADSRETLRQLLFAHLLGCALLGIFAMGTGRVDGRLDGVGGPGMDDANTLAMVLATGAIAGTGLVLTSTGWSRWIALAALVFVAEGFVLANSRGAFLGLVAGGLVLAATKARAHRRVFWAIAMVGVIGFAVVVDKAFIERMFTISDVAAEDEEADMSARSRRVIIEAQVEMAFDHPAGVGFRGTVPLSPSYLDPQWLAKLDESSQLAAGRASHNTFMTAWVEQGVPGLLLFLATVMWICAAGIRLRRLAAAGADPVLVTTGASLVGALAVVFVAGVATDYLMAEVQFWFFAALVSVLRLARPAFDDPLAIPGTAAGTVQSAAPQSVVR